MSVFDLVKYVSFKRLKTISLNVSKIYNHLFLDSNKSFTFAFENRKNISSIALSRDGNILVSVDEGQSSFIVPGTSITLSH